MEMEVKHEGSDKRRTATNMNTKKALAGLLGLLGSLAAFPLAAVFLHAPLPFRPPLVHQYRNHDPEEEQKPNFIEDEKKYNIKP